MDLEPVAVHDHLLDHEPQDGLLELEARILEPVAKPPHDLLSADDMPGGEIPPRGPGPQGGQLVLDSEHPFLDRRFPRLEIVQVERPGLIGVDQPLALPVQLAEPRRRQAEALISPAN